MRAKTIHSMLRLSRKTPLPALLVKTKVAWTGGSVALLTSQQSVGWRVESMSECLVFYVVLLGFPGSELGNWISVFFLSLSILFPISVPYFENELKLGCSRRKTHKQQQLKIRKNCKTQDNIVTS